MSAASTSCCDNNNKTSVRNPAPHRGFNPKARVILLDSEKAKFLRNGSDEEFLQKIHAQRLKRTDSEATCGSLKSYTSSLCSNSPKNDFDSIDDIPRGKRFQKLPFTYKLLGIIGKTKSTGDLVKKSVIQKTFQQMNILKLPSTESNFEMQLSRCHSLVGINSSSDVSYRQNQYKINQK